MRHDLIFGELIIVTMIIYRKSNTLFWNNYILEIKRQ